ncbi:unnamed protein product [Macrosiphum euphorbiae]|uniref:Uncharacterized protein n=1 Tax=Macrosiphum euphorbiae TaxID=13131 RepID=A0AAV0W911_9HEMI|nr:unnamed protein product [Macrosiphum euphorbiae]
MVKTDGRRWKPRTIYQSAYRKPSSSTGGGEDERNICSDSQPPRPSSVAVARFDRLLADRTVVENAVPPELAIPLRVDVTLSTYGRDYLLPSRAAAVAKWSSRRPEPTGGGPTTAAGTTATACERLACTASPRTNITYSGPAPPEPYVAPRSEYWLTHGHLGGRVIADGTMPKRTKRCQRINPTRIF